MVITILLSSTPLLPLLSRLIRLSAYVDKMTGSPSKSPFAFGTLFYMSFKESTTELLLSSWGSLRNSDCSVSNAPAPLLVAALGLKSAYSFSCILKVAAKSPSTSSIGFIECVMFTVFLFSSSSSSFTPFSGSVYRYRRDDLIALSVNIILELYKSSSSSCERRSDCSS